MCLSLKKWTAPSNRLEIQQWMWLVWIKYNYCLATNYTTGEIFDGQAFTKFDIPSNRFGNTYFLSGSIGVKKTESVG